MRQGGVFLLYGFLLVGVKVHMRALFIGQGGDAEQREQAERQEQEMVFFITVTS